MTTPRVTELPRRMEAIGADTFLAGCEQPPPREPGVVLQFRPRDGRRPRPRPVRSAAVPRRVAAYDDDVA